MLAQNQFSVPQFLYLNTSVGIYVGVDILPFKVLIFTFWSFLWSKTSMRKTFSSTLVGFPEMF